MYNPWTGELFRLGKLKEKRAGTVVDRGYRVIHFGGRLYLEHRLIWFMMTGEWPKNEVDHINRDRVDNRWSNLREATKFEQGGNMTRRYDAKNLFQGATKRPNAVSYVSTIRHNGKKIHLGCFETAEEAHEAYLEASAKLRGEFHSPEAYRGKA